MAKRLVAIVVFALTLMMSAPSAVAGDRDKDKNHHKTNATEMALSGLLAAFVLGAGGYFLVRRRTRKSTHPDQ